jgi:hypothetical protein
VSLRPPQGYGEPIHRLPEQGTTPVSGADLGIVYSADVSGIAELHYEDSGATVTQITDDGAIAGAVSPGGSAGDVQTNNGAGGFGGIDFLRFETGSVTTTDGTQTSAWAKGIDDDTVYMISLSAIARDQAGVHRAVFKRTVRVHRQGGGVATMGRVRGQFANRSNRLIQATFGVGASNIRALVTGLVATTFNWRVVVSYFEVE